MNQFFKFASILFFSTALISCGDGSRNDNATETVAHADEHADEHAEDHGHDLDENSDLTIQLNNGDKWVVNDEMKPHVAKGESVLKDYRSSKDTDYKSLAAELKKADKALISSCTMEGESHDELHKWLHPHLTLVGDLENAKSENEAAEIAEKLDVSYKNYHTYFQ